MGVTVEQVIKLLGGVKKRGAGYMARCPSHEDEVESLSVSEGRAGRVLLYCHAGCSTEQIATDLGLSMSNLMGNEQSAATQEGIVATYDYVDESGNLLSQKVRLKPKQFYIRHPDGKGGFINNRKGVDIVPYNLPGFIDSDNVFLVEGEKDVEALKEIGLTATCSPDGAGPGKFAGELVKWFNEKTVYIIPDNDQVGKVFASEEAVALFPVAKCIKVLDLMAICPNLPDKGDVSDVIERIGAADAKRELLKLMNSTPDFSPFDIPHVVISDQALAFPEFVPFEQSYELPSFPLETLPQQTQEFVRAVAENKQAHPDLIGPCVLGVLQVACHGRYPVQLQDGHIERPCLYIMPIARPSERKSSILKTVTAPLSDYEQLKSNDNLEKCLQSKSDLRILQGRIATAESRATKARNDNKRNEAENELSDLHSELAKFVPFKPLELIGADITPEKLAKKLKDQGEVFALISAEGGTLFENIGRYCEKGGLDIYLNGYSGDCIRIDRVNSDSVVLEKPTLSIIAPCQPYVVEELFSDKQKEGRGLLSRILFIKCNSLVGRRKGNLKAIEEGIIQQYQDMCWAMLEEQKAGNLFFDEQAKEVYVTFFEEIEKQLDPVTGELLFMDGWLAKLPGQMARIAGLLHCVNAFEKKVHPLDSSINENEAINAVMLAKYFLDHAKAVYTEQAEPKAIADARYLWSKINKFDAPSITKTDLQRQSRGKVDFIIDEGLRELVRRGYVRVEKTQTGGAGRPTETIVVNPEAKTN